MIFIKSKEEIALMKESALILSKVHGVVFREIKPGVTTARLNKIAEEFIRDNGGVPSFKGYGGFPAALCTSVNEYVVHGIPNDLSLKEGDIISVDCGVYYKGFHSDSAFTHPVGEVIDELKELLKVTKEALYIGINEIREGVRTGDIGFAIQNHVECHGYSVVRELVGHGIGRNLHESPNMPNYGQKGSGVKLKNGMALAIEPMVNLGTREIVEEKKGVIRTFDRKHSAHFEHTLVIVDNKAEVLTTFEYIEKNI